VIVEHVCFSPAKINLFLKVLSKRPDGYHNIISLITPVSLYDIIHIREESAGAVVVHDDKGILPEGYENTLYRAAALLKEKYNIDRGVNIFIEKNIPIGSGLGGPSSNAATVLKELIRIWELQVGYEEAMELGVRIGADVPLFIYGRPCVIEGIGERVSPVEIPPLWFLIVYPNVVLRAKDVYNSVKIVLTKTENDIKLRRKFETIQDVAVTLENDLEKVGITMCSTIGLVKARLMEIGSQGALMSGSGSSVFGIFQSEHEAQEASSAVQDLGSTFVVHSI
jgi:4-diphosphocytidyl-2-C-methyl-D-erythritol kinase